MKNQQNQLLTSLFGVNKTARIGAISATVTLLLLAVLIALNALLGLLPSSIAKPDVTGTATFKLSATTRDWLQELNEDVTLYLVCEDGAASADGDLYNFLERYGEENSRIRVKVLDPSADDDTVQALGIKSDGLTDMSIVVESADRVRVIDNSELYYYVYNDGSNTMTLSPEDYSSMYSYFMELDSTGETLAGFMSYITPYFDGDARVTNAINYVTQDKVAVVYVLTGSGASALDVQFTRLLHQSCYETRTLLNLTAVSEDCDVLVINSPTVDLTETEAGVLSGYLANGGKLFLTTYYAAGALPNLSNVLSAYGMSFETSVKKVYDGNPNYYFESYSGAVQNMFRTQINSEHAITGNFDESFVIFDAHAITVTKTEGVTVTPWLKTSAAGYLADSEEKGEYNVGVIAEQGETAIVWISSPHAMTQTYNAYVDGGNFTLGLSAFNEMSDIGHDGITVASAALESRTLAVSVTQFAVWSIILVVLIPVSAAVAGTVIWYMRKKR